MAAPFKRKTKVLLEKDCEFAVGIRNGRVLELRPEGHPKDDNHVTEVAHKHVCDVGRDFDDDSME